jgi:hypothetical protein
LSVKRFGENDEGWIERPEECFEGGEGETGRGVVGSESTLRRENDARRWTKW